MAENKKTNKVLGFIKSDLWIVILDILAVNGAYLLALNARFIGYAELGDLFALYMRTLFTFAPFYSVICIAVFAAYRLYGGMWKYAGMHDLNRILFASVTTSIIHMLGTWIFIHRMPMTYYALGAIFQYFFISIIRLGYRIYTMERAKAIRHMSPAENVMVIGSGWNVKNLMHFLENNQERNLKPVCIIDDTDRGMNGKLMDGVPVIGGPEMLERGIEKYKIRNIYIASPMLDNEFRNKLEEVCKERYLTLRDYAGYVAYLNSDISADTADALLRIVKPPIQTEKDGRRIIPFSPPDISEKEIGEVVEALRSGWITTGPRTKLLERRLAAAIETGKANYDTEGDPDRWKNRVACLNSATAAEELNLRILGIRPGDEVIVPAYTYTASASAAIHCGAKVIFVDIQKDGDPKTHAPEMDYEALEKALTEKTKAIITVDLGGIVCDYEKVFDIVERKKNLFTPLNSDGTLLGDLSSRVQHAIGRVAVVADCAHSLGASRIFHGEKKYCGAIADFSSFSFHAVKNFTTAEGGASTWRSLEGIDNSEIYKFYMLLSLHGQNKDALAKTKAGAWEYDIIGPWYKCNMTDIMAAIGLRQLDRYPGLLERRKKIIARYDQVCNELGIQHLNHHIPGMNSSNHLYLIRIPGIDTEKRNELIEKLAAQGVATNVHYKPMPMMTAYKSMGWDIKDFPNTYAYYENLITLPLHTLLTDEDVEYICTNLQDVTVDVVRHDQINKTE